MEWLYTMANGSLKQNKTKGKKLGNISLSEENHTPDFQLSKKKYCISKYRDGEAEHYLEDNNHSI